MLANPMNFTIDQYRAAQQKLKELREERRDAEGKIEQLKTLLEQLKEQRDALEQQQQDAPDLLVSGKMTDAEFSGNKKALAELYSQIDDTNALLGIYEGALNDGHSLQLREIIREIEIIKNSLLLDYANKTATQIAKKYAKQINQLVAVLELNCIHQRRTASVHGVSMTMTFHDLGSMLADAASDGKKPATIQEKHNELNRSIQEISEQIGI